MSLNGNETPLNKTHLFSPAINSQSPSSSNDHLLKYDIRRLRASLERKEEQISWWMEKSKNDNEKFEGGHHYLISKDMSDQTLKVYTTHRRNKLFEPEPKIVVKYSMISRSRSINPTRSYKIR
jgi:hypothetical protein